MDPRTALATELDALADITDQYADGRVSRDAVWRREARVHRACAALYREGTDVLRRAVRALAGLDPDALKSVTPDAMRGVMEARGWSKTGELRFPANPSRVAFESFDHPTAKGADQNVLVPQRTDASDYPRRVVDWAHDLAARHGDVAPAEVLAEVWGVRE